MWTPEANERRCALITKLNKGFLSPEEELELTNLQNQMRSYRNRMAALPIDFAKNLNQSTTDKSDN